MKRPRHLAGSLFVLCYNCNMNIRITVYDIYLKNRIVSTDSRNITPGCLFFALKGENFNGNQFAMRGN